MATLRDLLNRAQWRDAGLHALEVHVLHRGAPGDRRAISGSRIRAIRSAGIELAPETDDADPVFVPYHRFLAIRDAEGNDVWTKGVGEVIAVAASEPEVGSEAPAGGEEIDVALAVVLHEATEQSPLVIDGSAGEGGGQILRSSLALSMATGTPFVLENIRAGRKKPGLMRQHLTAVKAAAAACGAEIEGATLGSARLVFRPGPVVTGDLVLDIGSAGAVGLVLQTLAFPLALATGAAGVSRITVRGGTHAAWAPPHPFLEAAWLPLVRRAGADIDLELARPGFYPAGGGEMVMTVASTERPLRPLHIGEGGVLGTLRLRAIVSRLREGIARRELAAAAELLGDSSVDMASEIVESAGPGNAMWLVARDEATGVTNVFSGFGEAGVPAEDVGRGVAESFLAWRASGTSIEPHLADQVMLPVALAGGGSFTCNELTLHARTNMAVIQAFTGHRLRAWRLAPERVRVAL
ncbi:MAG: 3-terminal phosphate cyclase [Labilithrix sp.]|nr:3-terminal phosphate cyclase [Labilithrix sp.]